MFGSNLLNDDLPSIVKVNEICNNLGMDTITVGATIAYAIEC
jgi:aldehyde:ferredoxin oxidoreductase